MYLTRYSPKGDARPLIGEKALETTKDELSLERKKRDIYSIALGLHLAALAILIPIAITLCLPLLFAVSAFGIGTIVMLSNATVKTKQIETLWITLEEKLSECAKRLNDEKEKGRLLFFALGLGDKRRVSLLSEGFSPISEIAPHMKAYLLKLLAKGEGAPLGMLRFHTCALSALTIGKREGTQPTIPIDQEEELPALLTYLDEQKEAFTTLSLHQVAVGAIEKIPPCTSLYLKECFGFANLSPEFLFDSAIRTLSIEVTKSELEGAKAFLTKIKDESNVRIGAPIRTHGCTICLICPEEGGERDQYVIRASPYQRMGRSARIVIYVPDPPEIGDRSGGNVE